MHKVQTCKEEGNEKIFIYYMITQALRVRQMLLLCQSVWLRRYTQGAAGLIGVSLSGYSLLLDFENLLFANQVLFTGVDIDS